MAQVMAQAVTTRDGDCTSKWPLMSGATLPLHYHVEESNTAKAYRGNADIDTWACSFSVRPCQHRSYYSPFDFIMSFSEVSIVAIVQPNPGKLERLKEVISDAIEWIRDNEPETLELSLYECPSEDRVQLSMNEKYASQAAMDRHEASEHYQEFFKSMMEENLIAGPPTMSKGTYVSSLRR
ncbi:hypothetical protein KC315_g4922 [Hortaea werneckii]|nr:hypothetical protein KC315_g4922 [Hortaea werneckii]KAI7371157.1 hypothetical protein KC354_g744 [Hortaea werneckii]